MNDTPEKQTLVEEGTEFTGTLKAKCKVVVRGAVDGELQAPAVSITPTGIVTGSVKADKVESSGVLAGEVDADDISLAGEVRSNTVIKAKSLEVKLTSDRGKLEVTFGDCVLDVGEMPSETTSDSDQPMQERASAESSRSGKKRRRRGGSKEVEPQDVPQEATAEGESAAAGEAPAPQ